jgi:hypothetical protein
VEFVHDPVRIAQEGGYAIERPSTVLA